MKTITLNEQDAAQVKAIMLTHAEMSDRTSIQTEAEHGQVKRDTPDDAELLADLREEVEEHNEDTDNLKRLAALFD